MVVASGPPRVAARQVQKHVGGNADQFECQEQRDEIIGGRRQADSGNHQQDQGMKLGRIFVDDVPS